MISYVLGAPGSGKSTLVPRLRALLAGRVVLDWDAFMGPAGELAGSPIPQTPETWAPYGRLVRSVADIVLPADLVLLGVCTPDELGDWPGGTWILLDCSDPVRRERLATRRDPQETEDALLDAASYRTLGLRTVDTTNLSPDEAARAVADAIG